jgi:hypothetical protein
LYAFLEDIRKAENRSTGVSSKRILVQHIYATTEVKTVSCGRESKKIKSLFKINNLRINSLKKVSPKHLLHLLMAVTYRCLLNLSDRSLALPNDYYSCRIASLVKNCITASISMKYKLNTIFTGLPLHSASTESDKDQEVDSVTVRFALI